MCKRGFCSRVIQMAGTVSAPVQDWKIIVLNLSLPARQHIKPQAKKYAAWARVLGVEAEESESDEDDPSDPFEELRNLCAKMEGWTDDRTFYGLFKIDEITHVILLRDTEGTLKTFAFLHAPELPTPRPVPLSHAKCLLLCGTWKSSVTGTTGAELVQKRREKIARDLGYEDMDLIAANSALAEKVWAKLGFKPTGEKGEGTAVPMTKSLVPTSAPAAAPAAAGQGAPTAGRRKTRKPRRKTRKTRKNRK
jgi:hypothetical protein